ncbi:uncharacterized protein ACRADG_001551 [Cochliomyia hominivorax]
MLKQIFKTLRSSPGKRLISTSLPHLHRVTIIGSAGGIGQALSMLIKADPLVTSLTLMDIQNTAGIAADISHIDTFSDVKSFTGAEHMEESLECCELVVIAAGIARSEKISPKDLFNANKELIHHVALAKAKICPEAFMAIITNPVNSLVPLAAETLKQAKAYDGKKLFGVTKLNTMRSRAVVADYSLIDPHKVKVNVIGGNSPETIVPLLYSASPKIQGDCDEMEKISERIRKSPIKGKEFAQLSTAYAAATFCNSLLKALDGDRGVTDVAFVESAVFPEVKFFSSNIELNKSGVKDFEALPTMSAYEKDLLKKAISEIQKDIDHGVQHAGSKKEKK